MVYHRINFTLASNLKHTKKFGGPLNVTTGGKRTAPVLYAGTDRAADGSYNCFRVVLGKTIRVDMKEGLCVEHFPKKVATEEQVVAALTELFNLCKQAGQSSAACERIF